MALRTDDPFAAREADNYENPIPSREFIQSKLTELGRPLSHAQLCTELGLVTEEQIEALRRRLRAMERDGQLMHTRRGGYGLVDRMDLISGRVSGHRDGYGFLTPDDGSEDIYLHNRQMRKLFDGDKALVRPGEMDRRGRLEGKVVEVLERNTQQLVGRFYREGSVGFVVPENQRINMDIVVAPEDDLGADHGNYVLTEVVQQPGPRNRPRVRVIEVLGAHMAPGMEIEVAIRNHDIPNSWTEGVLEEAGCFGAEVAEEDKNYRIDLRDKPLVTIDGEDARDFDDAVYCERKKSGGWRLYVAIADVSHYVKPNSALDQEALRRGNSVYFPEHVVPMLPEALSNGLCSLNPNVDRLAMVCEMTISAKGKLSGYQFYEAVIRSHARLTYTQVGALLEQPESELGMKVSQQYADIIPHLYELNWLYESLKEARKQRGAIDFETTETRIVFGPDRKIEEIVPVVRNDAHKLIEECMLCANVATARFVEKLKKPGLFRVHQGPKSKKLESLRAYLGELGLNLTGGDKPQPVDYQQLLEQVKEWPDAHVIQTMMLRSLSQAVYTPENEGHFGLGYPAYTHFTSPIRRYPDLLTHRLIRTVIRSQKSEGAVSRAVRGMIGSKGPKDAVQRVKGAQSITWEQGYPYDAKMMAELGEQCSMTERRADEATWGVIAWLKCEFMQDCIGQDFEAVVSSVTAFGLFVELKGIYVEGLVHVTALAGDYYHFDAAKQRLVGERTRTVYRLGDELQVKVVRVDLDERKIDFELVQANGKGSKKGSKSGRRKSKKGRGAR
ncbi:ribonuclease R [Motiliproteus sp. MSK22-1]|uniref:ribonuclease R n=1 Tax=Motiliproteus sp. MSK22-1 TaxID=1897630 RepID=UPI0009763F9D|nr:ribonuclease R [Motiliproteus sp. MSK22-1]OMH28460.1 ribonuclease R [Motiliproteus sp. MSK22-1]